MFSGRIFKNHARSKSEDTQYINTSKRYYSWVRIQISLRDTDVPYRSSTFLLRIAWQASVQVASRCKSILNRGDRDRSSFSRDSCNAADAHARMPERRKQSAARLGAMKLRTFSCRDNRRMDGIYSLKLLAIDRPVISDDLSPRSYRFPDRSVIADGAFYLFLSRRVIANIADTRTHDSVVNEKGPQGR